MVAAVTGGVGVAPMELTGPRHRGSGIRNGSDTRGLTVSASHISTAACHLSSVLLFVFSLALVKLPRCFSFFFSSVTVKFLLFGFSLILAKPSCYVFGGFFSSGTCPFLNSKI